MIHNEYVLLFPNDPLAQITASFNKDFCNNDPRVNSPELRKKLAVEKDAFTFSLTTTESAIAALKSIYGDINEEEFLEAIKNNKGQP